MSIFYKRFKWTHGYDPGAWVNDWLWLDAQTIWYRFHRKAPR